MASNFKLKTLSGADKDIRSALDWFKENRGIKITDRFFKDYRQTKAKLRKFPHIHAAFYKDFRKFRFSKFAYKIIYKVEGDTIYIIAVTYDAREDYWKERV